MNHENINWDALVNYISGQSPSAEEEMIREWIKMDPKNEEFIVFLKKIWDSSAEEKHSWDVASAWSRFNEQYDLPFSEAHPSVAAEQKRKSGQKIRRNPGRTREARELERPGRYLYSWGAVAVSIAILLVVLFNLDISFTQEIPDEPLVREIVTKNGQRTHLNLSDGSRVVVNAGSRLTLRFPGHPSDGAGPREVHLIGEARFEVVHNPGRPFIVYTGNGVTKMLGTTFQVSSYPEDEQVQVVVSEGKVALQGRDMPDASAQNITKNQIGVLAGDGTITVSTITDLAPYLGWTEGNLVFHQEPFSQVIKKLERWYDIEIRVDSDQPELRERQLTATFTGNQPMNEVLEAVALTLDMEYDKEDGASVFTFYNHN